MSNNLKQIREKKGISATELAKKSGISRTIIWRLENGYANGMRISNADKLAKALDCTISDIFLN